jgi:hypothetical protein
MISWIVGVGKLENHSIFRMKTIDKNHNLFRMKFATISRVFEIMAWISAVGYHIEYHSLFDLKWAIISHVPIR